MISLGIYSNFNLSSQLQKIEANPNLISPALFQNLTMELEKLTVETTQEPDGMSPGNLNATVKCLESLVNIGSKGQDMSTQEVQSMIDTASTLLSLSNMDAWESVLEVCLPVYESKM